MKKIVIVGGGLGGLASAVTLAHAGFEVELFEKNDHLGGKLMPVELGSYTFDFGPNTITMPAVFEKVIAQTGENPQDYLDFMPLEVHTRNHFPNGSSFDFTVDQKKMIQQLHVFDTHAANKYPAFIKEISRLYNFSERYFFPVTFQSWRDYLSPSLGFALLQVRPAESMHHFFKRYFKNPLLVQAFDRYATYIGSSPYRAPATFSMIAYLELVEGVYYKKGGNTGIAQAFSAVARNSGAVLQTGKEVTRILTDDGQAKGIELKDGTRVDADLVILNGDLLSAFPALVEEKHRPSLSDAKVAAFEPSISAFVITVGLTERLDALKHHNVFFSSDYQKEFSDLFDASAYSDEPTVYISNSSYTDPSVSPDGDNLFILVNAPALTKEGQLQIDPETYKERIYDFLLSYGIDVRSYIAEEKIFTPAFIGDKFGAFRGALYGPSSNRPKDAFLRPPNASRDIQNLYFVGGSSHPGGGSPMVVLSGLNVANKIIAKYKKTASSK
ncbi:phytoene desaturase family protein [Microbacterium sp. APC 3898]|uniref:4,4'-diaponeurosporene oxygenase n=1 Tax=Planococcus notacanthi TaxID=3035188 RepID=A0ABT7ZK81_9BACL|nr:MULTISPECIES: phytoene desaturase family protein [Terrabacteria group]MDN3427569.1 phytoene desaturase family protein [Planococcus sp. APC 4016]MDN3499120.1 phytoene desaturase family protein [Microbacterium sp. APC 3898]